ncbi:protein kinase [candidate division KSB1 bacterium]|nr:protein kinase [candidate division KSB1 bacterium]
MTWYRLKTILLIGILSLVFTYPVYRPAKASNQGTQIISSIQNHLYQGEKYLEKEDYQKAEEQFVLAIRLMPQGPTALLARVKIGFIYYRQNRFELAQKELNIVLKAAPDNREAQDYLQWIQWILDGENAFNSNQFIKARDNFQHVLQTDSANQYARKRFSISQDRGNALSCVQKFNEALAANQISTAEIQLSQIEEYWKDYPELEQLRMILANLKSSAVSSTKSDSVSSTLINIPIEQKKKNSMPLKKIEYDSASNSNRNDSIKKTVSLSDTTELSRSSTTYQRADYFWYFFIISIFILSSTIWYFLRHSKLKNKTRSLQFEKDKIQDIPAPVVQNSTIPPANQINSSYIGKYEIIAELEHGGMGRVVKARHPHFRQPVVIKSLLPEFTNHPVFRQRLFREANILFELDHPNIVRVMDLLEEKDQVFMVMQFVDGKNLYQYVQENGPLKTEKAIPLFIQACQALAYLHEHKIIHRDIKPQNMMLLRQDEKIKLVDFGIVKPMTSDYGDALTSASRIAGTPNFMSPEQLLNDDIDPRTDIFSLGISLFFVLTGVHPFEGYGISIMRAILEKEPQKLTAINPALDQSIENVCSKMMARDREDRYQNVIEVENALQSILAH